MGKLDKTETLVTTGDMTYVREVTETDLFKMYVITGLSQPSFGMGPGP